MKNSLKTTAAVIAALGLGVAMATSAHPGPAGGGYGPHGMGMGYGGMGGMAGHGMMGGRGHGMGGMGYNGTGAMGLGQSLMTPEERAAYQQKMQAAGSPEERRKLIESMREDMHKRALEQGIAPCGAPGRGN